MLFLKKNVLLISNNFDYTYLDPLNNSFEKIRKLKPLEALEELITISKYISFKINKNIHTVMFNLFLLYKNDFLKLITFMQEKKFPTLNDYEFEPGDFFYFGNIKWNKLRVIKGSIQDTEYYFIDLEVKNKKQNQNSISLVKQIIEIYKNLDDKQPNKILKKYPFLFFLYKNRLLVNVKYNDFLYINNSFYCIHCLSNSLTNCSCRFQLDRKKYYIGDLIYDVFSYKRKHFFIEQKNYLIQSSVINKPMNYIKGLIIYYYRIKKLLKIEFLQFLKNNYGPESSYDSDDDFNLNGFYEKRRGRGCFIRHFSREKNKSNERNKINNSEINSDSSSERCSCNKSNKKKENKNINNISSDDYDSSEEEYYKRKYLDKKKNMKSEIVDSPKYSGNSSSDSSIGDYYSYKEKKETQQIKAKNFSEQLAKEELCNKIRMSDEQFINLKEYKPTKKKKIKNNNINNNLNIIFKIKISDHAYKCFLCNKILNKKEQFNQHFAKCFKSKINLILNNEKIMTCPYCNFEIKNRLKFPDHMKQEHFFIFNNV